MRLFASLLVLIGACGTPPAKSNNGANNVNSATNNADNNVNSATNSTANNVNSATNNTGNNVNGTTGRDIWARDYDQTCGFDGDCTVVHEGDACLCGGTACGNTGINTSDIEMWSSDREALCPPGEQMCSLAPCPELLPVCTSDGCDAREPVQVDPTGLDTSCEVDEDCTIIVPGELCSSCRCGGEAVNTAAAEEYLGTLPTVDCRPGPTVCGCAVVTEAYCNDGTCAPGAAG